jgi:hypothetical protein
MTDVKMKAPAGLTGAVQTEYGTVQIDANGFVTVDARVQTVLLGAGFTAAALGIGSQAIGADGVPTFRVPILSFRSTDGAVNVAAAAGKFGLAATLGTSHNLVSEAAQNNTKTDIAFAEVVLPANYVAGQDIVVTMSAKYTLAAGTAGACTIDLQAYEVSDVGAHGADICATAAQALTAADADYAFTLTGTNLAPGDRIALKVTQVIIETANGGTVTGSIASVRVG